MRGFGMDNGQPRWSDDFLLAILDASPLAVIISDFDGRVLFSNAECVRATGVSPDRVAGRSTKNFYVDETQRDELLGQLRREGSFRNVEILFRTPLGRYYYCLSSAVVITFDGAPAILGWHYDITARKEAEAARLAAQKEIERALSALRAAQESLVQAETMASLGELVASIAHEVETPIGIGVTTATHLADRIAVLRREFESGALRRSELEEFLATATEGSRLLASNLIRADELIQGFKRVAVDRSSGVRRVFALRPHIEETLFTLRPRLKRGGIAVALECREDLLIDSFPGALSQVLTNLILNAIVHAFGGGQGHGQIQITAETGDAGWLNLTVADDGIGIAPADLPHVFEPFFTTKRETGGSGLGLHIVRNVVEHALGGRVSVESEAGRGSRFHIELPVVAPDRTTA